MNLRHAAALALVGWYLMVPPGSCKPGWISPGTPQPCAAPLSDWIVALSFFHQDKCDEERSADISYSKEETANARGSTDKVLVDSTAKLYWRALTERCVSTDDPNLEQQ
jgi:hypothetical protein